MELSPVSLNKACFLRNHLNLLSIICGKGIYPWLVKSDDYYHTFTLHQMLLPKLSQNRATVDKPYQSHLFSHNCRGQQKSENLI